MVGTNHEHRARSIPIQRANRATGYVAGPTGSLVDDLLTIKSTAVEGKPVAGSIMNAARNNLPLQNLWWGKAAFDHFVWSELMDYAQPGYSSRVARRQRQNGVRPNSLSSQDR